MFGVLVAEKSSGEIGYLKGFSGMIGGKWLHSGFVPPVFNPGRRDSFFPAGETELAYLTKLISEAEESNEFRVIQDKLVQLEAEWSRESGNLKRLHKERRLKRHAVRAQLPKGDTETLNRLSLESQKDHWEFKDLTENYKIKKINIQSEISIILEKIKNLKVRRAALSNELLLRLFEDYNLMNTRKEVRNITEFFPVGLPPGGTGECAGPKLLQFANLNGFKPIALAEFWWGSPPADEIRKHGQIYPACKGKCGPILPFMLEPYSTGSESSVLKITDNIKLTIIYEDEYIVVINKPSGMLSVPGKKIRDSVLLKLQKMYPDATGPLLVHRLDMSTSGLLLAAKNSQVHKALQKQFLERTVKKQYSALLNGLLPSLPEEGVIDLPLRVDLNDRPRQMVCFQYGKPARTVWKRADYQGNMTRVHFYPVTGRTHQLRVHAAHPDGLGIPVKGDDLYGDGEGRLMLHAFSLTFVHPVTGETMNLQAPDPF